MKEIFRGLYYNKKKYELKEKQYV
ncbi:hypothetical protein B14911_26680 [Bacillus sp. NRRL B-14911]|nr:hypothetical protein B14911_26680 [Bacillus sp. NRRL B-14911]